MNNTRRFLVLLPLVLLPVLISAVAPAADRPNVLVILTDDQGWGDLSLHGNRNLSTPNIVADTFQEAGYATAAYGKWHNGMQYPYHPNGIGFDDFYGFCSGHWGDYFAPPLEHNGRIVQGEGFMVDDFTDHAMRFMEEHKDRPFFVYLPLNTSHSPMPVPDRWWNKFQGTAGAGTEE